MAQIKCTTCNGTGWVEQLDADALDYLKRYPDVANSSFRTNPRSHYDQYGKAEGRRWGSAPVPPGPQPPGPTPPPGLIASQPGREFFSSVKVGTSLFLGDYGMGSGGPKIQILDSGGLKPEFQVPECESAFDLYFGDGVLLCSFEARGQIRKRIAPGNWPIVYQRPEWEALGFYIRRAGNSLFQNWAFWDHAEGGVLRSDLKGESWQEASHFHGKTYQGMFESGGNIYLAGMVGGFSDPGRYPALGDIGGNPIFSRPDQPGRNYGMGVKIGNRFVLGNCAWGGSVGMIDVWEGGAARTTLTNERNVIALMQIIGGKIYAVLTYDWEAPANKISELISSSDNGDSWKKEADIPMPHVMHMYYSDGFYFCGGRHGEFGKVFYWR